MCKSKNIPTLILCLFLAGCEEELKNDWYAIVTSDTSWEGDFSAKHIEGSGDQTVDLPDDFTTVCCVVKKKTDIGRLKVEIRNKGSNPTSPGGEWGETREPYGVISVCSGNKK